MSVYLQKKYSFLEQLGMEFKKQGLWYIVWARFRKWILDPLSFHIYTIFFHNKTFYFQGETYSYFHHWYNFTWKNERAIEIPIFLKILRKAHTKKVLEVGNVLSHYVSVSHEILDKYEQSQGVINEDVVTFSPKNKYDLIIAISTLEHVGWHETSYQKDKVRTAIQHLQTLLKKNGKLYFSVPLGLNTDLDRLIAKKKLSLTSSWFIERRTGFSNEWIETNWSRVKNKNYNSPYPNANAVMIGLCQKK